jgi:hypothetical protein
MQHPPTQSQTSLLLKLPTELIHKVLSDVLTKPHYHFDDDDDYDDDDTDDDDFDDAEKSDEKYNRHDDRELRNSPVLTIRSVCRAFRSIVAELPFWWEDNKFDVLRSLKPAGESDVEDAKFLSTLFEDPCITQSLAKRKHWHIHDVPCLVLIMESIPSFSENTTSVTINELKRNELKRSPLQQHGLQWLDIVIGHLATSQHIRSIELGPFDRSPILKVKMAEFWPELEKLTVWLPFRSVEVVNGFTQLRTMEIRADQWAKSRSSSLLPFESAATLTHLHIGRWPPGRNYLASSLNVFVNLVTLHISALTDDICSFLLRFAGHLRTFSARSYRSSPVTLRELAHTFSASCLQTIENLTFKFDMELGDEVYLLENDDDLVRFDPLVEAVTKIISIQFLHLQMPLDARWYRHFPRLIHLKELSWSLDELVCLNLRKELLEVIEERDYRYDYWNYLARKIFLQAFAESTHTPRIHFNIWFDSGRSQRLTENPPEEDPVDLGHNRAWGDYDIYEDEEYWEG